MLRGALFLDGLMDTWYELVVYAINLFIVFVTPDALDMVLNSLAFEFILQLDDVVKEKYITIHAKNHDNLIKKYEASFEFTREAMTTSYPTRKVLNYHVPTAIVTYILPPLALVFLPACKPGIAAQS